MFKDMTWLVTESVPVANDDTIGTGSATVKIGTSAPTTATVKEIDSIVEDNKFKQGKFIPGVKIPIVSKESFNKKADCALVLAWNFFDEISKKNINFADKFVNIKELEKD